MEAAMTTQVAETSKASNELTFNTAYGEVTIREDRLISFPTGILGFAECTSFGLSKLPNVDESPIMLLQCTNESNVAFLVADPAILGLELAQEDREKALRETAMNPKDTQFLVILTAYPPQTPDYLTANMRAPLMVDTKTRIARQHILSNKDYTTQHKI